MKLQCTLRAGKDDYIIAGMRDIPSGDRAHVIRQALTWYLNVKETGFKLPNLQLQAQEPAVETNILESLSDL